MSEKSTKVRYENPVIKLAVERKLVSRKQHLDCRELVKKSRRIGLETTIEEIMIKQGFLSEEQLEELQEISRLGESGDYYGGYRLQKLVGQGGMGKVYRALHEFTLRCVALKILSSRFSSDKTNVSRFFQEVRALAKLNHPNIVTLYDAGKSGRRYYFTMELVEGLSLDQYIKKHKKFTEKVALKIIRDVAVALGYAHQNSIIHRDIKPENILVDDCGVTKVTDFGVVMHQDDDHLTLTAEGFMVGSIHFASPEQINGLRDIDGRTDIYSLGATLFFMLTGRTVYSGKCIQEVAAKQTKGPWVSPRKFNRDISIKSVLLIRKMMAKNRERRFQSMEDLIKAIDRQSLTRRFIGYLLKFSAIISLIGLGILLEVLFSITTML
ncbi:serine/threonine-protein kinase [Chitinispirillales bacterium ANBcel5]|uniref:serine/threonine protein kinase n=1 Tax=Cellulosispirillum alkaliphilum TaxID=3039283 RepID=UPI002A543587|nr:serine/threonine-protein kinase [Chitinispirillales bacterium ANBcel5]